VAYWIYTLALSGDRVSWGTLAGNMGQTWALAAASAAGSGEVTKLGSVSSASGCAVSTGGLGDLTADASLLVFSTWRDEPRCPKAATLEQQVHRVDGQACPCPVIASSAGPLPPFDVEGGRLVVGGMNATQVRGVDGNLLVSVPVSPLAAQLTGSHLVILVQGQMLDYDAVSGVRLHAWPVADVSSGGECGSPHGGTWECNWGARLMLQDAKAGLAAYVLDEQVHILRLADGADAVVAPGQHAGFTTDGLVYADGEHLRLRTFASLPLRAW
jgi:hypothetical protein